MLPIKKSNEIAVIVSEEQHTLEQLEEIIVPKAVD
jgi:hypothetical protein